MQGAAARAISSPTAPLWLTYPLCRSRSSRVSYHLHSCFGSQRIAIASSGGRNQDRFSSRIRLSFDDDVISGGEPGEFDSGDVHSQPEEIIAGDSSHVSQNGNGAADEILNQQDMASLLIEEDEEDHIPVKDILDSAKNAHSEDKSVKGAKLHDFCLGIPYGALLVLSGIVLFILTGSASSIQLGLVLGGLLLTLSTSSFNAWKKGKSSMSYIQGQAAIAFVILFVESQKAIQTRSFIAILAALISGAMFGFYCYVFVSGGNPPKKLKPAV